MSQYMMYMKYRVKEKFWRFLSLLHIVHLYERTTNENTFSVRQLGSQLWFIKRARFPLAHASITWNRSIARERENNTD